MTTDIDVKEFKRELKSAKIIPITEYLQTNRTTPALSKIIQSSVNNRLIQYLNGIEFWFDTQDGFWKGSNIQTATGVLITDTINKVDKDLCLTGFR